MSSLRCLTFVFLFSAIAGCKILITVPKGGSVATQSETISCDAEQECSVDVVDVFFDETFQAIPAEGHVFVHWRKRHRGFCGGSKEVCRLFTSGFEGNDSLEQILASEEVFYLEPVFIAPDSWERKTAMPQRLMGLGACALNGRVYAVGGFDWRFRATEETPGMANVEAYDPVVDAWQMVASMNLGRKWLGATASDERCYAVGGQTDRGSPGERSLEEYNPETNAWRSRSEMPAGRLGHAAVALSGKLYVMGGTSSEDAAAARTLFVYDIEKDSWSRKADMPRARSFLAASVVDGKIYVFGGVETTRGLPTADVLRYDPASNSWSVLEDMPTRRAEHSASAVNGKIYVMGSRDRELCVRAESCEDLAALASVDEFDPETGTWASRARMLGGRTAHASVTVGGRIYAVGGTRSGAYGRTGNTANEEYTPPLDAD